MFQAVSGLRNLGYYVEAFQVDSENEPPKNINFPAMKSTPEDLRNQKVDSVPLLLIGDMTKKVVYRVAGYQNLTGVFNSINEQEDNER